MVLAGIAYAVTTWKLYITSVSIIGLFGIIVGLVAVQTASISENKSTTKESAVKQVRRIAKTFFSSSEMIVLTIKMVGFISLRW